MAERDPRSQTRRHRLERATKLLGAAALMAFAWILTDSAVDLPDPAARMNVLAVDLTDIVPGETRLVDWGGRHVLVQHRTAPTIAALAAPNPSLHDPGSDHSIQPGGARNPHRSLSPEFFVALAHDTGPGCLVEWTPPEADGAPRPWHGGFRDRCTGSWYDPAGRVYRGQQAPRNLVIPPHSIRNATELLLGG